MQAPQAVMPATFYRNAPLPGDLSVAVEGALRVVADTLQVEPLASPDFIDLTARVEEFVARSGVRHGQLTIHSLHTTAAVVVNEREPLLIEDTTRFLEQLAPTGDGYGHDDFTVRTVNMVEGEGANAHAHLQHLLLGATKTLPIVEGRPALGQWQRIFLIELDQPRARTVLLQALGVSG